MLGLDLECIKSTITQNSSVVSNQKGQLEKTADRLPILDGIRGLACLIVLMAHAVTMFLPHSAPYLAGSGKIGVWPPCLLEVGYLKKLLLLCRYGSWGYGVTRFICFTG